jgi:hypothetical protein
MDEVSFGPQLPQFAVTQLIGLQIVHATFGYQMSVFLKGGAF